MSYSSSHQRLGPTQTPKPLKILILATLAIALFSALFDNLFLSINWLSPQTLLSLSIPGIQQGYYWQFISYLLVGPLTHGITFSLLLHLAFNAYLLWVMGATLIERKGLIHFFVLYLSAGLFSGLSVFALQTYLQTPEPFAGNLTSIYALLMAWTALYPEARMLLFLSIPMRARNLIYALLGVNLLIDISTGSWLTTIGYGSGALFGYCYGRILAYEQQPKKASNIHTNAKIYDFKTGKALMNDHEFLDAMLTKISLHGRDSLTWKERWRLRRISKRKKKDQ